jgi:hypothetical protein
MCEKCRAQAERNTATKRAAREALFAAPPEIVAGHRVAEIPGYLHFLFLCDRMERMTQRVEGEPKELPAASVEEFKAFVFGLTPEERTAVIRIAQWTTQLTSSIAENVATAKVQLRDQDGTSIAVMLEGRSIVVRVNGVEKQRIELDDDADADAALDAAERAMRAHREQYSGGE